MQQARQRGDAVRPAAKRIPNQLFQVFTGQRRERDFLHSPAAFADHFDLAHQRMAGIDLVASICTDQHQVSHIRLSQQVLEQIEGCCIEPLQIIQEEGERMLRPCKYADKSPEDQLEPALRVECRKNGDGRLFSYDQLKFRNQVDNKQGVRAEGLLNGITPDAQLRFALAQKRTDKTLKRLR